MTMRKNGRCTAAWVTGAAVLLLTGCGGGARSGDDSKATALSEKQVHAVLPDGEAMPGWRVTAEPLAIVMNSLYKQRACPNEGNKGCEQARFYGLSTFHRDEKKADAHFQIVAYKNEQAAEAAYDVLWKGRSQVPVKAKELDLGGLGENSNARVGTAGFKDEPGAVSQVRVGTTLLWTQVTGKRKGDIDDALVKDLTSLLTARAQQMQDGDTSSAALNG